MRSSLVSHRMKPETVSRRSIERKRHRKDRAETLGRNLARLAKRDGIGSIWPEMLAEHVARMGTEAL